MNRVLFVDDEPRVLEGLRRMLYSSRLDWDMRFVTSGAEALESLSQSPFDVLVTDVRMPAMSGIELLDEVAKAYPQVVRIVLSGTADMELTLQSVSRAHQYLLKPCDARTLRAAVERASCMRVLLNAPELRGLISQIQSLPSLPPIYNELVQVIGSSESSVYTVGAVIARDMGMTAKVLQLVNSAFFGISRVITNPVDAVVYLGMETVRALVLTASAFSQFKPRSSCSISVDDLQQHSLRGGTLARRIALSMGLSAAAVDHALVGGLLHDIGKLVLISNCPKRYDDALRLSRERSLPISEAERESFGTDHSEIGAYLLWLWGLPDPITEIVALHHRPSRDAEVTPSVLAVHFADALVNQYREELMDLDSLRMINMEAALPGWRRMYDSTLEELAC